MLANLLKNKRSILYLGVNLKRRVYIALSLVTILPIIVLVYYLSDYYISWLTIAIVSGIVLLGWWIIFEVFTAVLKMHSRSQTIVEDMQLGLPLKELGVKDEVESLWGVFNLLSSKVKDSLEQLQTVNEKTALLNKEISQKVELLASILQVNSLFSKGANTDELFQLLIERIRSVIHAEVSACILKRENSPDYSLTFFSGTESRKVNQIIEDNYFKKLLDIKEEILVKSRQDKIYYFIHENLGVNNICIFPIYLRGKILGFIIVGFILKEFTISTAQKEVIEVFARNISILWEHRRLMKKVEDLEVFDALTGIYTDKFFSNRLDEEIKRSVVYQRPCGFVVVNFANYNEYQQKAGSIETEKFIKRLVQLLQDKTRPIDIFGRIQDDKIGLILIERNKRQCKAFVQEIEDILNKENNEIAGARPRLAFAIAENPIDGGNSEQLFKHINTQLNQL